MRTIKKFRLPFSRNYVFIAIAVLITLYGIFWARTHSERVYSIGAMIILIPFLEMRGQERVMQLFVIFFVCIQVSSIALFDRLPYQLLISSQPFWTAVKKGIPTAFIICAMAHLFFWRKTDLFKLYGIQFPIMIIACTWYIRMLLIMANCQHIPNAKAVRIPAIVIQKCPACCDLYELWFSFNYEGQEEKVSINVNPQLHEQTNEGDSLILQMHPGRFGWPWYHKDIKRRYR
ncbi:hypothetical protein [Sphingobacterium sp. G1-14]|uniref:hypothetical protein n=1 Tax=Sphingobacterium sp. G1-14 TaxID=2003121 RepID=UPI000B48DAD4|nr:hypothetical protein [Sphingobacterium sp. G1-14]